VTRTKVLSEFLSYPDEEFYAYGLALSLGMQVGSVMAVLRFALTQKWVVDRWTPSAQGRPPRRMFRLTPEGHTAVLVFVQARRRLAA
jgi:DNA-binding PadR family transcriptional regulator